MPPRRSTSASSLYPLALQTATRTPRRAFAFMLCNGPLSFGRPTRQGARRGERVMQVGGAELHRDRNFADEAGEELPRQHAQSVGPAVRAFALVEAVAQRRALRPDLNARSLPGQKDPLQRHAEAARIERSGLGLLGDNAARGDRHISGIGRDDEMVRPVDDRVRPDDIAIDQEMEIMFAADLAEFLGAVQQRSADPRQPSRAFLDERPIRLAIVWRSRGIERGEFSAVVEHRAVTDIDESFRGGALGEDDVVAVEFDVEVFDPCRPGRPDGSSRR